MTAASPPMVNFGLRAPEFHLPDTKGKIWTLNTLRGSKGVVLMFLSNQCPYVLAVIDKLVREGKALRELGFGVAAICANDVAAAPEDSYEKMGAFARQHHLSFPYLHDLTQSAARAYGAACTPDIFGFNAELRLQYRGRLDDSGPNPHPGARRELYEAMKEIAATGQGPREPMPAIGCSIKWKAA